MRRTDHRAGRRHPLTGPRKRPDDAHFLPRASEGVCQRLDATYEAGSLVPDVGIVIPGRFLSTPSISRIFFALGVVDVAPARRR